MAAASLDQERAGRPATTSRRDFIRMMTGTGGAGAARQGAKTVLLEESYVLGGNLTRGLVSLPRVARGGPVMVEAPALPEELAKQGCLV